MYLLYTSIINKYQVYFYRGAFEPCHRRDRPIDRPTEHLYVQVAFMYDDEEPTCKCHLENVLPRGPALKTACHEWNQYIALVSQVSFRLVSLLFDFRLATPKHGQKGP